MALLQLLKVLFGFEESNSLLELNSSNYQCLNVFWCLYSYFASHIGILSQIYNLFVCCYVSDCFLIKITQAKIWIFQHATLSKISFSPLRYTSFVWHRERML